MNSIRIFYRKIKGFGVSHGEDFLLFLAVFFGVLLIFGIVSMSAIKAPEIIISELNLEDISKTSVSEIKVVGNKGSKIFHLEECPGALAMNEVNKVFFDSANAALAAGYRAAKNCPGLEYLK